MVSGLIVAADLARKSLFEDDGSLDGTKSHVAPLSHDHSNHPMRQRIAISRCRGN